MKSQPSNYFHPARNASLVEVLPLSGHMLCIDRGAMERRKIWGFSRKDFWKKRRRKTGIALLGSVKRGKIFGKVSRKALMGGCTSWCQGS
ncbi:hypothetical protein CDAR_14191 [Caerostris darwini]|uniref:Ribosomal protein S14 n=1 Tax=Caerostris darwini TaxID=1538125 RepID=A0AAV4QE05_9ARAC|nr:hypothetical protein CDAR_14191 [Caerostris darwini]